MSTPNTQTKLFGLVEHTCKTCGKKFEATAEYVYKLGETHRKMDWFCSYSCMRKKQKKAS